MIHLEQVTYCYPDRPRPVLERFDLRVSEGEMLLVTGASGVGKSSLLRLFNGLVPHFHGGRVAGRVRVAGRDPIAVGPRGMSDQVGFVTQDPEAHFVAQVVEDELAFAMENHGLAPSRMRQRIEEVLDQLSCAALRHRRIETLSGGERQRIAIGSVLTLRPEILVLDEPTSQLDPQAAEEVLTLLQKLNDDFGMTVIFSEHRLERVVQFVDRVLLLEPGAEPQLGAPAEVLARSELAPPLVSLGARLGWEPVPLTLKEARRHPASQELRQALVAGRSAPGKPNRAAQELLHTGPSPAPRQAPKKALEVRDLWVSYDNGKEALKGVDLEVERGECLVLMGRNGAGKSTLLKTLVGLLLPRRGLVRHYPDGGGELDPVRLGLAEVARFVGFVPQNPSRLLFHETVEEEIRYSLQATSDTTARSRRRSESGPELDRVGTLLAELGLEEARPRDPRDLSTGERQRVAVAAVLAAGPEVLLLDEPTRGLDAINKTRLLAWLDVLRERGMTVVLATHDVELAAICADRVVVLGDGHVVVAGATRQILGDSPVFSPQIHRWARDPRFLTVADVLEAVA